MICKNPAHAAAGRFPKQPSEALHGRTGKSPELLDARVIPVTKLPAKGKTPGLKISQVLFYSGVWDVSILLQAPGKGIFGGGERQTNNKITQGDAHKK